ncbi:AAA family ATPase [Aerosakkonema sp. BLCC-F183]|uniref:trifunctional serine/threonine-protein kinase/ATP-binding protein/sensor histidine kinase n=1 Tax=Aerosakkonema sp. BLCC-F183 TaxID=3342834 RepID=UPI0035B886D3
MIDLPGIAIKAPIYESVNSEVYRGIRVEDNQPAIVKVLKQDYPTPDELRRYKQEYEISCKLNIDGVCKAYGLESYQRTMFIIFEDFGGESLKKLMKERKFTLAEVIRIGVAIADSLGHIHAANIIHKDINPSNIVFNPETQQLKIIDFGISSIFTRENPTLKNPNVLEGTLAYISPEQTGRMNRFLDYRTDFYSLGVTFYELLTGKLPFETTDALELLHCHIAKQPNEVKSEEIPQVISDIIMKLMAKNAEDRYQTAWGIKADLEECLSQLQTNGFISSFPLASQDISDKFQIPQKLYGREREVETLLAAFERVSGTEQLTTDNGQRTSNKIEMMLVTGYSGIGKSVLVQEIHKPITEKRGYFISGKFDQFQRNVPYSAVVSALEGLVRQILTESDDRLKLWRQKLEAALGSNGQVIIDVIPEVELIVGKQPAVPELGPQESQNRFNLVFQNFIRTFCLKEHPLVIFLDDLQWADAASLKFIELMMTEVELQYLFSIGAYRDNEVNPSHPLMITIDELQKKGATVNFISLTPLNMQQIGELIADTLHSDTQSVKPLAKLVDRKTEGNPFFVNEFLKTLHAENLLNFNLRSRSWQWNINQIEAVDITDNVVELMIGKLKKLPDATQQVLRLAACVGASFDLNTLSIICEKSPAEVFQNLIPAVQSALILAASEWDYQLLIQNYQFLHDRVQQAAYALINDEQKQAVHLQIGRLLLQNTQPQDLGEKIFEIVDHLDLGVALVSTQTERNEIARLNLIAGEKAKAATAYEAGLKYLTVGMDILDKNRWADQYELSLALHKERAEVEYLSGNFERSEKLFTITLKRAKSNFNKLEIYRIYMNLCMTQGKFIQAVSLGLDGLRSVGIDVPNSQAELLNVISAESEQVAAKLQKRNMESLLDDRECQDDEKRLCMNLIVDLWAAAYLMGDRNWSDWCSFKIVNFTLTYGVVGASAFGYILYGFILAARCQYPLAYQFGQLGFRLINKLNIRTLFGKVTNIFAHTIGPYQVHLRNNVDLYALSTIACLECGDLIYGVWAIYYRIWARLIVGDELAEVYEDSKKYLLRVQKINDMNIFYSYLSLRDTLRTLLDDNEVVAPDELFDEALILKAWQESGFNIGIHWHGTRKLQVLLIQGEFAKGAQLAIENEKTVASCAGFYNIIEHYFYSSLCLAAHYPVASEKEQQEYRKILADNEAKMKIWADNCPVNYLHKYLLIEAEIARLSGQDLEAIDYYDRAIESASENKYIQNEALAHELAAKFWLSKGKQKIAQVYMTDAYYCYLRWGAQAKVKYLESKYPHLITKLSTNTVSNINTTNISVSTTSSSIASLDFGTLIKASQAISGEILLEKLLSKLMKIIIENAGAQIGYLVLHSHTEQGKEEGQLLIEASGVVDSDNVAVLQSVPIENRLPVSIVNYVARTKETIVLNDAVSEMQNPKSKIQNPDDPYIKKNKPKSILCAPLMNQGKLWGIVYLENNLTAAAFTPNSLEVLQLLSGQAAIAIANAKLYAEVKQAEKLLAEYNRTLEIQVAERTQELSQALENLKATQEELIQSEKMAALGQLVAGVAHEVNTPLGAIRSSVENIAEFMNSSLQKLPEFFQQLSPERQRDFFALLQNSTQQTTALSSKERRSFKRALVSQLNSYNVANADTVADTLVDLGIYENLEPFLPLLKDPESQKVLNTAYQLASVQKSTQTITTATNRAAKIVFALKSYARYDHSGQKLRTNITDGIETVLTLYHNQLKHGVEVVRNYDASLPTVLCYPDELNQVWTNLIHNALQAMHNNGTLTINVTAQDSCLNISITDSGTGIPPEIMPRIFEPFFTTKPAGEGSGLGLNIVQKIIDKHEGKIWVDSVPGKTKFTVSLPIN